jgi:uncharacterized protein (TIGR02466 family)|tara:strand:+ start:3002 stop:3637 length:636 start_codon:yes stop_codon:yes gene_type:complete
MKHIFNQQAEVQRIFPTSVYKTSIGREILNQETKAIEKYLKDVECNTGLNFNSKNNYVLKDKLFKNLNKFLQYHIEKFFYKVFHADPKNKIYITQSWLNITTKNQSHHTHEHPNSFISGVFYFAAEKEDSIKFTSPIRYTQIQPKTIKYTEDNSGSWVIPIAKGLLIMFPSRLEHSVITKQESNNRISLAFNTFIKGDLGDQNGLTRLVLK